MPRCGPGIMRVLQDIPLLIVGNECEGYLPVSPLYIAGKLKHERFQPFSLLNQPRDDSRLLREILADEGINGNFMLTVGVGDNNIPLSPDTIILPSTVQFLPDNPDITFAATRLLGLAYSVATAPAGSLPEGVFRVSKSFVFVNRLELRQKFQQIYLARNWPSQL